MNMTVLLCTYNGVDFIKEQLQSLEAQIRAPDQLLIYDWGSNDDTVDRIERFMEQSTLSVFLYRLGPASGVYSSFKIAIKHALKEFSNIEYLALCDQDDIWEPSKLKEAENLLSKDSAKSQLFFSDVSLIDRDENMIVESRLSTSPYFSMFPDRLNDAVFLANPVVGMTCLLYTSPSPRDS